MSNDLLKNNPDVLKSFLESMVAAAAARTTPAAENTRPLQPADSEMTKCQQKRPAEDLDRPESAMKAEPSPAAYKAFWSKFKRSATVGDTKPEEPAPTPNGSMVCSTAAAAAEPAAAEEVKPEEAPPTPSGTMVSSKAATTAEPAAAEEVKPEESTVTPSGTMVSSEAATTAKPAAEEEVKPEESTATPSGTMVSNEAATTATTAAEEEVKPEESTATPGGTMVSSEAATTATPAAEEMKPEEAPPTPSGTMVSSTAAAVANTLVDPTDSTATEEMEIEMEKRLDAEEFERDLEAMMNASMQETKKAAFQPEKPDVAAALMRKTTVDWQLAEKKQPAFAPPPLPTPAQPVMVNMPGHKKIRMLVGDEMMDVWVPLKKQGVDLPATPPAPTPAAVVEIPAPAPADVVESPAPADVVESPAPAAVVETPESSEDVAARNGERALRNTYMRFLRSVNSALFAIFGAGIYPCILYMFINCQRISLYLLPQ